jgi:hypothetical protein
MSLMIGTMVFFFVQGCIAGSGGRDIPQSKALGGTQLKSVTNTPLSVRVEKAEQLASVSSILVLAPTLSRSNARPDPLPPAIGASLESIAERELSVKVLGNRWISEVPTRSRVVEGLARADSLRILQSQGIDAVLRTDVVTFTERRGSSVGGEPANVTFIMSLVRTVDGVELWQGRFAYSQTFLSENLLQLGDVVGQKSRGRGWSSGREIFEAGFSSALRDLNTRREQQFLALRQG